MEHTPELWEVEGPSDGKGLNDDGGDFAIFIQRDGAKYIIAEAFHRTGKNDFEAAEVNAYLMAASPDLFKACEAVIECSSTGDRFLSDTAFELAQAAIAKAKHMIGREPSEEE